MQFGDFCIDGAKFLAGVLDSFAFSFLDYFEELNKPLNLVYKGSTLKVDDKCERHHAEDILLGGFAESVHAMEKTILSCQVVVLLKVVCHAAMAMV